MASDTFGPKTSLRAAQCHSVGDAAGTSGSASHRRSRPASLSQDLGIDGRRKILRDDADQAAMRIRPCCGWRRATSTTGRPNTAESDLLLLSALRFGDFARPPRGARLQATPQAQRTGSLRILLALGRGVPNEGGRSFPQTPETGQACVGDQLARQWQLIQRLAKQQAPERHLDDLAEELEVREVAPCTAISTHSCYAGFPVVSEKRDGRTYYRFLDSFRLGDVPFTPGRSAGPGLRRGSAANVLEGTVFHDSIGSALGEDPRQSRPGTFGEYLARLGRVLPCPAGAPQELRALSRHHPARSTMRSMAQRDRPA